MKYYGIRKGEKQRAIALKDAETEEAYCFLTVNSLLAFSKKFSYKNLTRTVGPKKAIVNSPS